MNHEPQLIEKLEALGYFAGCWVDVYSDLNECKPEEAKQLLISNFEAGIVGKVVSLPKVKEVTVEYVLNKVNQESTFKNLVDYCTKIVNNNGISIYPTSYGIGCFIVFGRLRDRIEEISKQLTAKGIEFTNEFSDAGYVYRFKISKSAENIEKLKQL